MVRRSPDPLAPVRPPNPQARPQDPFVRPDVPAPSFTDTGDLQGSINRAATAIAGALQVRSQRRQERAQAGTELIVGNEELLQQFVERLRGVTGDVTTEVEARVLGEVLESAGFENTYLTHQALERLGRRTARTTFRQFREENPPSAFAQVGGPGLADFDERLTAARDAAVEGMGPTFLAGFEFTLDALADKEKDQIVRERSATARAEVERGHLDQAVFGAEDGSVRGLTHLAAARTEETGRVLREFAATMTEAVEDGYDAVELTVRALRQAVASLPLEDPRTAVNLRRQLLVRFDSEENRLGDGRPLGGERAIEEVRAELVRLDQIVDQQEQDEIVRRDRVVDVAQERTRELLEAAALSARDAGPQAMLEAVNAVRSGEAEESEEFFRAARELEPSEIEAIATNALSAAQDAAARAVGGGDELQDAITAKTLTQIQELMALGLPDQARVLADTLLPVERERAIRLIDGNGVVAQAMTGYGPREADERRLDVLTADLLDVGLADVADDIREAFGQDLAGLGGGSFATQEDVRAAYAPISQRLLARAGEARTQITERRASDRKIETEVLELTRTDPESALRLTDTVNSEDLRQALAFRVGRVIDQRGQFAQGLTLNAQGLALDALEGSPFFRDLPSEQAQNAAQRKTRLAVQARVDEALVEHFAAGGSFTQFAPLAERIADEVVAEVAQIDPAQIEPDPLRGEELAVRTFLASQTGSPAEIANRLPDIVRRAHQLDPGEEPVLELFALVDEAQALMVGDESVLGVGPDDLPPQIGARVIRALNQGQFEAALTVGAVSGAAPIDFAGAVPVQNIVLNLGLTRSTGENAGINSILRALEADLFMEEQDVRAIVRAVENVGRRSQLGVSEDFRGSTVRGTASRVTRGMFTPLGEIVVEFEVPIPETLVLGPAATFDPALNADELTTGDLDVVRRMLGREDATDTETRELIRRGQRLARTYQED